MDAGCDIYEVIEADDNFKVGDEVVIENTGCSYANLAYVAKVTHVRIDSILAFPGDENKYWFTNRNWIDHRKLEYRRTE